MSKNIVCLPLKNASSILLVCVLTNVSVDINKVIGMLPDAGISIMTAKSNTTIL